LGGHGRKTEKAGTAKPSSVLLRQIREPEEGTEITGTVESSRKISPRVDQKRQKKKNPNLGGVHRKNCHLKQETSPR